MRKLVKKLIEAVEELLNYHGVKLPDENRQGDPDEACLFGKSLYALEDKFKELILESGLIEYEGTVELTDIFFMNLDAEYKGFKESYLNKTPEEVFEDSFKINFFTEVYEFIKGLKFQILAYDDYGKIVRLGYLNFLDCVYDFYLDSTRRYNIYDADDMIDLITDTFEALKEKAEEV